MPIEWRALANKSRTNITIAERLLYDDMGASQGIAAFHAQQAVELAVKACVVRFGLHREINKRDLRQPLFNWNEDEEIIKSKLLPYLKNLRKFAWLDSNSVTFVKVKETININNEGHYLTLYPEKTKGIVRITTGNETVHELPLKITDEKKLSVYSIDKTFRTHDPILPLLEESLKFTQHLMDQNQMRDDDTIMRSSRKFLDVLSKLVDIMREIENNDNTRIAIWNISLRRQHSNNLVKKLEKALSEVSTDAINDFSIVCMNYIRTLIFDIFFKLRKAHKELRIRYDAVPAIKEVLAKHGLPENLGTAFLSENSASYFEELHKVTREKGGYKILNLIFRPGGMLDDLEKVAKTSGNVEFKNIHQALSTFSKRYAWLAYVASLASIMVLMLPHESIGRYPEFIDGKESDSIYIESFATLEQLIRNCSSACKNIADLLEN